MLLAILFSISKSGYFIFFTNLFIYLFIFGCVGSSLLWQAFSSCGEQELLFLVVCVLLIAVASRCGARALGTWASVVVVRRLSSYGSRALEHRLSSCGTQA